MSRGLNPHIEDIARRFALATSWHLRRTDSSLGGYLATTIRAARCSTKIDKARCHRGWWPRPWLKSRPDCTGKISYRLLLRGLDRQYAGGATGADLAAATPFYGGPPAPEDIPKLRRDPGASGSSTTGSDMAGLTRPSPRRTFHDSYIYPGAVHAIVTRRRNGITKPLPIWPAANDRLVQQIRAC